MNHPTCSKGWRCWYNLQWAEPQVTTVETLLQVPEGLVRQRGPHGVADHLGRAHRGRAVPRIVGQLLLQMITAHRDSSSNTCTALPCCSVERNRVAVHHVPLNGTTPNTCRHTDASPRLAFANVKTANVMTITHVAGQNGKRVQRPSERALCMMLNMPTQQQTREPHTALFYFHQFSSFLNKGNAQR